MANPSRNCQIKIESTFVFAPKSRKHFFLIKTNLFNVRGNIIIRSHIIHHILRSPFAWFTKYFFVKSSSCIKYEMMKFILHTAQRTESYQFPIFTSEYSARREIYFHASGKLSREHRYYTPQYMV